MYLGLFITPKKYHVASNPNSNFPHMYQNYLSQLLYSIKVHKLHFNILSLLKLSTSLYFHFVSLFMTLTF